MYINSGVEGENLEKAEKAILKEIEDMKIGQIADGEAVLPETETKHEPEHS